MVFTNIGKSGLIVTIGQSSSTRPQYMAIGSGSGTVAVANTTLVHEVNRTTLTSGSVDVSNYEIEYVADWSSVTMSGIDLREFGMFTESAASTGSLWNREAFNSITFDGSNELQIQLTYEVY